jgi:hypothetical protein
MQLPTGEAADRGSAGVSIGGGVDGVSPPEHARTPIAMIEIRRQREERGRRNDVKLRSSI